MESTKRFLNAIKDFQVDIVCDIIVNRIESKELRVVNKFVLLNGHEVCHLEGYLNSFWHCYQKKEDAL